MNLRNSFTINILIAIPFLYKRRIPDSLSFTISFVMFYTVVVMFLQLHPSLMCFSLTGVGLAH